MGKRFRIAFPSHERLIAANSLFEGTHREPRLQHTAGPIYPQLCRGS
jgi:hypothetical protein